MYKTLINKRKKIFTIIISVILVSILLIGGCGKKETEITIGSTVPLTGEASTWGNYTRMGAKLAVDEYNNNKKTNQPKVNIIFEDTKAIAKEGISAFNKLLNTGNVNAIVDDAVSSVALAMAPIANDKKTVIISTGATNPKLSEAGPYYFRVWNSDFEEGLFSAKYCYNDIGMKDMAMMFVENDYGEGLSSVFKNQFEKLGGRIIITETYKQGSAQFRNQISKIKKSNPQGLYLVSYPEETPQILLQMENYDLNVPLIGTVPMQDESIIEKAKEAAEGVIYPYPVSPEGEVVNKFIKAYKDKYKENPGTTSAEGYDAAKLIIEAILSNGNNGDAIKRYLDNIKNWKGASGIIEFDKNGDVHKPMVMKTIKNSEFVITSQ